MEKKITIKYLCSSNMVAVGLSAGFLMKQQRKKSLPSCDIVSGIGGVSFKTLNIAAGCHMEISNGYIMNYVRGGQGVQVGTVIGQNEFRLKRAIHSTGRVGLTNKQFFANFYENYKSLVH